MKTMRNSCDSPRAHGATVAVMADGKGVAPTGGERHIAGHTALGRRNDEIAEELQLRAKTVEWTLTCVYRKRGVRSRTEAERNPMTGGCP